MFSFSWRDKRTINDAIEEMGPNESNDAVYKQLRETFTHCFQIGKGAADKTTGQHPAITAVLHQNPAALRWLADSKEQAKYKYWFIRTDPHWDYKDFNGKTALIYAVDFCDMESFRDKKRITGKKGKRNPSENIALTPRQECIQLVLANRFPNPSLLENKEARDELNFAIQTAIKARNIFFLQELHRHRLLDPKYIWNACEDVLKSSALNLEAVMYLCEVIKKTKLAWTLWDMIHLYQHISLPEQGFLRDMFLHALSNNTQHSPVEEYEFSRLQKKAITEYHPQYLEYLCHLAKIKQHQKTRLYQAQLLNHILNEHAHDKLNTTQTKQLQSIVIRYLPKIKPHIGMFKDECEIEFLRMEAEIHWQLPGYRKCLKNNRAHFTLSTPKKNQPLTLEEAKKSIRVLYLSMIAQSILTSDDLDLAVHFSALWMKTEPSCRPNLHAIAFSHKSPKLTATQLYFQIISCQMPQHEKQLLRAIKQCNDHTIEKLEAFFTKFSIPHRSLLAIYRLEKINRQWKDNGEINKSKIKAEEMPSVMLHDRFFQSRQVRNARIFNMITHGEFSWHERSKSPSL